MDKQQIDALKKEAKQIDSGIIGWDIDIQNGMLWAEYQTDAQLGIVRGIRLLTGKIVMIGKNKNNT